jgi:enoyl-CoA hydratase
VDVLRIESHGATRVLIVDRPETKNAVDPAVHDALRDAVDTIEVDPSVRAIVLTGVGRSFLSGGDLKFIREHPAEETLRLSREMNALLDRFALLPIPVIAAINGICFGGGCEIALACDYRIADLDAKISFRQAAMGLTTGWGATTRLSRLVFRGAALRLLCTAEVLDAERAAELGIVDELVPAGKSVERALTFASAIAALSPRAIAAFKRTIAAAYTQGDGDPRALEWEVFTELWGGADHKEALEAFFEKRAPEWPSDQRRRR